MHRKINFKCLSCARIFQCYPNQKWCREPGCRGQLVRVGQCFVCLQFRATDHQVVCLYCEPVLLGLRKLLEIRLESEDGGYAPVEPGDIRVLTGVVYAIIEAKWGKDADGDLPVEPRLVDRSRYSFFPGRPLPYLHKAELLSEFMGVMRIALANVMQSMKDYQDVQQNVYDRFFHQLSALKETEIMFEAEGGDT